MLLFIDPDDSEAKENLHRVLAIVNHPPSTVPDKSTAFKEHENMVKYAKLCRSHGTSTEHTAHHLTCQKLSRHPGLVLRPVAMEILSVKPYIVFFHDVLSAAEIDDIIHLATPKVMLLFHQISLKSSEYDTHLILSENSNFSSLFWQFLSLPPLF